MTNDVKKTDRTHADWVISRMVKPSELEDSGYIAGSKGNGPEVWAMFRATIRGDLEAIRKLVKRNPDLVRCVHYYTQPLKFAVRARLRENHIHHPDVLRARQGVCGRGALPGQFPRHMRQGAHIHRSPPGPSRNREAAARTRRRSERAGTGRAPRQSPARGRISWSHGRRRGRTFQRVRPIDGNSTTWRLERENRRGRTWPGR